MAALTCSHYARVYCLFSGTNRAPNTVRAGSNALPQQSCSQYSPCMLKRALSGALPPPIVIPPQSNRDPTTVYHSLRSRALLPPIVIPPQSNRDPTTVYRSLCSTRKRLHPDRTHVRTTMLIRGPVGGPPGPPLPLISIVKPKRGVGSHVEKGWDPPGSHQVPRNPIWVPRRGGLGPTRSHETRFGSHVEESWDPPGPTKPDLGPT